MDNLTPDQAKIMAYMEANREPLTTDNMSAGIKKAYGQLFPILDRMNRNGMIYKGFWNGNIWWGLDPFAYDRYCKEFLYDKPKPNY